VRGGIKAHSRGNNFGQNWWARRWQDVLEGFHVGGRLARGRSYARGGQVLEINFDKGEVKARVQGSRLKPYLVTIRVKVLDDRHWGRLLEVLSGQARYVAKLLAGEMPEDIEAVFQQARLSLFPARRGDLDTDCSCPDEANPCKHIAAVYYLLGEEFDRDPFLLFRLRGLDREELLARLGTVHPAEKLAEPGTNGKAGKHQAPAGEPLPTDSAAFWAAGEWSDDRYGTVQQPPVSAGWLRRLGKFPFWRGERPMNEALEPVYVAAGEVGLRTFLGSEG
jgi:uncharacterized Zn finger protein